MKHLFQIAIVIALALTSCHSTRQAASVTTSKSCTAQSVRDESHAVETLDSSRALSLVLDSFEMWMDGDHFAGAGNMITGIKQIQTPALSERTRQPGTLIRARRATITSQADVQRTTATARQHNDSMQHQTTDSTQWQEACDSVAVTKPPDIPWLGLLAIAVIGVLVWRGISRLNRHNRV